MKKFVVSLIIGILLVASVCLGANKTLTFTWQQDIPEGTTVTGWKIYQKAGTNQGIVMATVPFTAVQSEYTFSQSFAFPDGQKTTAIYYMTAYNDVGESGPSNEVPVEIDLTFPKPVPPVLKIIITVGQ